MIYTARPSVLIRQYGEGALLEAMNRVEKYRAIDNQGMATAADPYYQGEEEYAVATPWRLAHWQGTPL